MKEHTQSRNEEKTNKNQVYPAALQIFEQNLH